MSQPPPDMTGATLRELSERMLQSRRPRVPPANATRRSHAHAASSAPQQQQQQQQQQESALHDAASAAAASVGALASSSSSVASGGAAAHDERAASASAAASAVLSFDAVFPDKRRVKALCRLILALFFPGVFEQETVGLGSRAESLDIFMHSRMCELHALLVDLVAHELILLRSSSVVCSSAGTSAAAAAAAAVVLPEGATVSAAAAAASLISRSSDARARLVSADASDSASQACGTCEGGGSSSGMSACAMQLSAQLMARLPAVRDLVDTDAHAAFENDPAAESLDMVVLSYPFIEAIAVQRFAHEMYVLGLRVLPRMMCELMHKRTGIDIHPGASIGPYLFIDHGTGVVIGETTTIGSHCILYHNVTLGALNPQQVDEATGLVVRGSLNKRHPDLGDHVIVYSGAAILGGSTRVGSHSVIGANAWITRSVPEYTRVSVGPQEQRVRTTPAARL